LPEKIRAIVEGRDFHEHLFAALDLDYEFLPFAGVAHEVSDFGGR
jgi:hypothetical protein